MEVQSHRAIVATVAIAIVDALATHAFSYVVDHHLEDRDYQLH